MITDNQKIKCPWCGEDISIDEVITNQIKEKALKSFKEEQLKKDEVIKKKEKEIEERENKLASEREGMEKEISDRIKIEKEELIREAKTQAKKEKEDELNILEDQIKKQGEELLKARKNELLIRKEKITLEEEKKAFELEKQRQLDEERRDIEKRAEEKAVENYQFKIAELNKKLGDASKANEDLKRKLEQGSQQSQGEVLELELEDILKREFIYDKILPVPKGVKGADIIHKVCDNRGNVCGHIIWESKRTKNWSEGWIQKLKDDQRDSKSDIAVIVSISLPDNVKSLTQKDNVWITNFESAIGLATALRTSLIQIAVTKAASVGKNEKMELLYSYLSGTEFKQRVEIIVETFMEMKRDIDKEKLYYEKKWAKQEKQTQKVIANTVGMYGDLGGLMGSELPQIKMLELPGESNE